MGLLEPTTAPDDAVGEGEGVGDGSHSHTMSQMLSSTVRSLSPTYVALTSLCACNAQELKQSKATAAQRQNKTRPDKTK